ncbi:MAG: alanine racemase [Defluviicoccus sp.]
MAPVPDYAAAILTIDLGAVVANWRLLRDRLRPGAGLGAAVKANAYGLGAREVTAALAEAGCRSFFVATLEEGIEVRAVLAAGAEATARPAAVYVLNGPLPGADEALIAHRLTPVLNSREDIAAWSAAARRREARLPAALHVDTGMARLGLPADELARLVDDPGLLAGIAPVLVMSHLACADQPEHPLNERQRQALGRALAALTPVLAPARPPVSLANSAGIFLGHPYHFDLARPGAALYGVQPLAGGPNPMRPVVTLRARILQVRTVAPPATVGYGATYAVVQPSRIATVAVGYADGYLRSLSNRGRATVGAFEVPLVGRVSMDLITVDVSAVPAAIACPGAFVELIGASQTVDAVAERAGTIGYEILTALGSRYARVYRAADAHPQ